MTLLAADTRLVWRAEGLACFVPRPRITPSAWAEKYFVVPNGPEPGRLRLARTPYLREPLDAIADPDVERIIVMASSQIGKSLLLLAAIGFHMHQAPAPILVVQPSEKAMRDFAKERISPTIAASEVLRALVSQVDKDQDATILSKQFPGGGLWGVWASSASQIASRAIQILIADELDRWPAETVGADGDPWAQAVQRTSNFGSRRKILAVSTPTLEGQSRIAALYGDSDQRHFHVPCPQCGTLQPLEWSRLEYKNEHGLVDLDGIRYVCAHCNEHILDRHRPQMIAEGAWVAHNPGHPTRGYHVNSLVSPFVTWRELVTEWVHAVESRDDNAKRAFYNLRLGEPWRENVDRITVEALEKNIEHYDTELPDGVLFLTAGCDTQDNRLEAFVVGWGEHRESFAVEYAIIPGNTEDLSPTGPWARLDAFLSRTWSKADGSNMSLSAAFVDSGGHRSQIVHRWTAERAHRGIYACHGVGGAAKPICGKPTSTTLRTFHYPVGSDAAKSAIYSRLQLATPGPGYVHFPADIDRGFDDEFFRGLLSERLVIKRGVRTWVKSARRNEPIDTFAYALAAMEAIVEFNPGLLTPSNTPAPGRAAAQPRRRVISRGVTW